MVYANIVNNKNKKLAYSKLRQSLMNVIINNLLVWDVFMPTIYVKNLNKTPNFLAKNESIMFSILLRTITQFRHIKNRQVYASKA